MRAHEVGSSAVSNSSDSSHTPRRHPPHASLTARTVVPSLRALSGGAMRSLALVIGGLVLASSVATAAAAQGIGDAARKERSRRAAAPAKEPARVYVIDGSTSKDKSQSSDSTASPSGTRAGTALAGEPSLAAMPTSSLTDGPTDSH